MAEEVPEAATGLPPIDPVTGYLPPGIHPCTWDEFVATFVDDAPHQASRRRRLLALQSYVDVLDELLPGTTLWLDGGFTTHKATEPFDIDVVAVVDPQVWTNVAQASEDELQALAAWAASDQTAPQPKTPITTSLSGLLTLMNVRSDQGSFPRTQPFGGRIDGFIIPADATAGLDYFRTIWTEDYATGAPKGFVEVRPDDR